MISASTMTLDVFFSMCENAGVTDASYIVGLYIQANLETDGFKSRLYTQENNLFGMRPSKARTKYYSGVSSTGNGEFASYDNAVSSIMDRVDLDRYNNVTPPQSGYLDQQLIWLNKVLSKGYVPQNQRDQYVALFKSWYNRLTIDPNLENATNDNVAGFGLSNSGQGDGLFDFGNGFLNWKFIGIPIALLIGGFIAYKKFFKK